MKIFGLITATLDELLSILIKPSFKFELIEKSPFEIYKGEINKDKVLYIIHSDVGQNLAAIATTYLILNYHVEIMFNYGVVGGLKKSIKYLDTCLIKRVVHYEFDTSEVDLDFEKGYYAKFNTKYFELDNSLIEKAKKIYDIPCYTLASGNKFISKDEEREYLSKEFNADVCDMELAAIYISTKLFNIPLLSLKGVSDSYGDDYNLMAKKACKKTSNIILKLIDEL